MSAKEINKLIEGGRRVVYVRPGYKECRLRVERAKTEKGTVKLLVFPCGSRQWFTFRAESVEVA